MILKKYKSLKLIISITNKEISKLEEYNIKISDKMTQIENI